MVSSSTALPQHGNVTALRNSLPLRGQVNSSGTSASRITEDALIAEVPPLYRYSTPKDKCSKNRARKQATISLTVLQRTSLHTQYSQDA
jgi:hypothetical protein